MLYIITALKSEAQAFVDKYRLSKTKCGEFTVFAGENIRVAVSGVGTDCAKKATQTLVKAFAPTDDDIFLNVGICGANKRHNIGKLLKIGQVVYEKNIFAVDRENQNMITCINSEMRYDLYDIVDMESFGFYEATANIKKRYIYKVVSDHFEPDKVTKDGTKKLILNAIDEIIKEVEN